MNNYLYTFYTDNLPYEKVGKNEPVCIADEVPFDIPESWEWVRLKDLAIKEIKRGKSPKYADDGSVYVFAQKCNVKLGGIDISLAKFLDMKTFEKYPVEEYMVDEDIIINSTGNGTLGRIGMFHDSDRINDFIIVPDSHVTIIRACNQLKKDYLFYVLKYYQPYLEKLGEGSTNQTELRPSTIAELFVPIPSVREQERIVAKLLEVLPMVDVYGEKEKSLQSYNTDFPTQLKKSILQEAVQGKLVPQDPSDEPASVLLERIRAEKEQLIKAGLIKRDKHESVIFRRNNSHYEKLDGIERCIDNEIPFEIPENWRWVRFSNVALFENGDRSSKYPVEIDYVSDGIPFFGAKDMDEKYMSFDDVRFISEEKFTQLGNGKLHDGDLVCLLRGSVGKTRIFKSNKKYHTGFICAQMMIIRCMDSYILDYVYDVISSPYYIKILESKITGTAVRQLPAKEVARMLIPIPPLSEQQRIVEKQRELFDKITMI